MPLEEAQKQGKLICPYWLAILATRYVCPYLGDQRNRST
jgi:hypothetical protein